MSGPIRVQRRRTKGWRMPENTVSVTRGPGSTFGNPFDTAAAFRDWLAGIGQDWQGSVSRSVVLARLPELRGKNLACWCPLDAPCHADVLLELANQ